MRHQSTIFSGHNLRSVHDPVGYTRATPDPKHHGQAMRSPMRTEWIKSQGLEMQGLWSRGVFQQVSRTSFTPQDRCHGTLQGRGRLRVTDSKRLLLYGKTVLLRSHEIIVFIQAFS